MVVKAWLFSLGMLALGVILSLLVVGVIKLIYKLLHKEEAPEADAE